ncbi:hypothetical protein CDAR_249891 [Caerostris darwini]|uniref:Uncharacterized protein n=1 Tax=Caerostris darwini TaxID=1538125 RepID=A0AAV4UTY9_9ARAC|nr:hypothetical protein CDAR_249891 [Caerostris darwini]
MNLFATRRSKPAEQKSRDLNHQSQQSSKWHSGFFKLLSTRNLFSLQLRFLRSAGLLNEEDLYARTETNIFLREMGGKPEKGKYSEEKGNTQ